MYSSPFMDLLPITVYIMKLELFEGLISELMTFFSAGSTTLVMVSGPADVIVSSEGVFLTGFTQHPYRLNGTF